MKYFIGLQPVGWPLITRNSSTLSSCGEGMTDSSRIISSDGTRRKVLLLSSLLMSEEEYHYIVIFGMIGVYSMR